MAYSRRDVYDGVTVMNKDLYDNLQDGIDELIARVPDVDGRIIELIRQHNLAEDAHPYILEIIQELQSILDGSDELPDTVINTIKSLIHECNRLDAEIKLMKLRFDTDVTGNPFTVTFEDIDDVDVTGVWNSDMARMEF